MSAKPVVSVVIPTYNRAGIIRKTIDNVFEQTYQNFEIVVVDDGSTDDTLATLSSYGTRIRVISQANAGPAIARNRGVEAAHGEIIAFQDSDDLWDTSKLARQVNLLRHYGRSVPCCLCNVLMRVIDGKRHTSFGHSLIRMQRDEGLWLNVAEVLATRFVLFNQACAVRRDAFERAGGYDPKLKYLEDYDLPLRLALEGPWAFIRDPLVIYGNDSPESFSGAALKDPFLLKECELKIYEQLLKRADIANADHRSIRRNLLRRQGIARRQLRGIGLNRAESRSFFAVSKLGKQLDRLYLAAFRRSPWFPQPETMPVGALASNPQ